VNAKKSRYYFYCSAVKLFLPRCNLRPKWAKQAWD
jgi:hypothetical protein